MMNSNHLKYIWLLFSELAPVIKYVLSKKVTRDARFPSVIHVSALGIHVSWIAVHARSMI